MKKSSRLALAAAGMAALTLAACVPPAPEPSPSPAASGPPSPQPQAAPPIVLPPTYDDWMDAPRTPGDWRYSLAGGATIAEYLSPSSDQLFRMTCAGGRIELAARGADPSANAMTIRTETQDRTLPASAREGWLATTLPARDPFLDAMAFSKGRFAVTAGTRTYYVPAWPEVTRVIEDCR